MTSSYRPWSEFNRHPWSNLDRRGQAGRLVRLDVQGTPVLHKWNVVVRSDLAVTPAVPTLFDFLCDNGASLVRGMVGNALAV